MQLFRAVRTKHRSQNFSENRACARVDQNNRPFIPYQIVTELPSGVCPQGYKRFYPMVGLKTHGGEDWVAYRGEPVYFNAVADTEWEVFQRNDDPGYGLYLEIRSLKPVVDGKHVKLVYVHALKNLVAEGDRVVPGQQIQEADSTGASSGHHLHFSMKFCDAAGNTLNKGNGWNGSVDPAPYSSPEFVLDFLGLSQRLSLSLRLLQALLQLQLLLSKMGRAAGGFIRSGV